LSGHPSDLKMLSVIAGRISIPPPATQLLMRWTTQQKTIYKLNYYAMRGTMISVPQIIRHLMNATCVPVKVVSNYLGYIRVAEFLTWKILG
jgi:hypothetical protein